MPWKKILKCDTCGEVIPWNTEAPEPDQLGAMDQADEHEKRHPDHWVQITDVETE